MKGFFDLRILRSNNAEASDSNCEKCGLYKTVKSPNMPVNGRGELRALFIAEAPGVKEDDQNKQLVGGAGQLLQRNLERLDLDLERDFWRINAVNCRPANEDNKNRPPTKREIQYCRPKWKKAIQDLKPTHIVLAGGKAVEAYFGDRKNTMITKDLSISRWRGLCIPDKENDCWVIPIIHPSYPQYNERMEEIFFKDLKWMDSCLGNERPDFELKYKIITSQNLQEILSYLENLNHTKSFAYDFETTCLKPYYKEAKLLTVGIATEEGGFSFPYNYRNTWSAEELDQIKKAFSRALSNENISKIVQNRGMEENWSRVFFCEPKGDIWDTQLASHVVDERDNFTGLKFQAFVNWGIIDYDKEVDAYKNSVDGTVYNRMEQLSWYTLCKYNAWDAVLTHKLKPLQERKLRQPDLKRGNKFLQEGMKTLVKMTHRGLDVNKPYYINRSKRLTSEIIAIENEVKLSDQVQIFERLSGVTFDMNSPLHLRKLLFGKNYMNLESKKQTTTGLFSVDAESLERVGIPLTNDIVRIRKLKKVKDYVDGIIKLTSEDGKIHPSFNLHLARTYRSSSDGPNLQNFPKRDEVSNRIVRSGIISPEGKQIMAVDFGAMEVRGFAWYSKDPVLTKELIAGMDPHGVWAEFFGCSRFDAKNTFVFPLIYGSYYKSIHREFLNRGYENITLEKCKAGEDKFWAKYNYAKQWQERIISDYYQKGYVESYFGLRRRGILSRNQIVNFPIQATCFHCLIYSFNRLDQIAEEENWKTIQVGQIHDENFFILQPEEFSHVGRTVERVMVDELMQKFDWMTVPPLAEVSVSEVSGTWADMFDFTKAHKNKNPWDLYEGKTWEGETE